MAPQLMQVVIYYLFYLGYDGLESLGMVNSQVGKNLAVNLDSSLVQQSHQLRVTQSLQTCSSIDTLNPQGTEIALLVPTVTESVGQTLFPSVLGNGPYILAGTKITSGQTQNFLSLSS